jgi:nucleoside-diphosphate-sugar epimerase
LKIIVTGATGWIGRSALEVIDSSFPRNIELIGISRSPKQLTLDSGRIVKLVRKTDESIRQNVIGLVHAAFPTQNLITHMGANKYNTECDILLNWLRDYLQVSKPNWLISISSGVLSVGNSFDPRHSGDLALYSKWKKIEENIALESSIKSVLIGRLFSTSGRFMTKPKSYALGDFITAGILGQTISVRSILESKRSYIDAEEFLRVLLKSVNMNERLVIDSSGKVLSIVELATIVQEFFPNSTLKVPSKLQSGSDDYFSRDPIRFENLAKISNIEISGIREQISRTITGIRKSSQS